MIYYLYLSPWIFNIVLGRIIRKLEHKIGTKNVFAYADDIVIFIDRSRFDEVLNSLKHECSEIGMEINFGKSKLMPILNSRGKAKQIPNNISGI